MSFRWLCSAWIVNCCSTTSHVWLISVRSVVGKTGKWVKKYKKETRIELEKYWMNKFSKQWQQSSSPSSSMLKENKFYCLAMFPYPSGKLHMGHVRVYTISDTMAHYHRMQGKQVIHPMGWDSFGLPAENAAISNNRDPQQWTDENIIHMKQQLRDLNLRFDWDREFSTCSPEYYRWTQYLFVKLFRSGLAYQKEAMVNWDPIDRTVLADEQVDEKGRSWRSDALVEKRLLNQWFLKATKYSQSLLNSIDEIKENVGIKSIQKNWIGLPEGTFVDFKLKLKGKLYKETFPVFCSHPEYIGHASHINLHSNHSEQLAILFDNISTAANVENLRCPEQGAIFDGIKAINPFNNFEIPFVTSDHLTEQFKSSNVLGIPLLNENDKSIASRHSFSYNSNQDDVLSREDALRKIRMIGCGHGCMTSSGLRDWLISRQRRWGTPIPIIHCPEHGAVVVDESQLPVLLPKYNEDLEVWKQTTCPLCGRESNRETDTMDTFVDSSWYFLRFTDPHNKHEIFSNDKCDNLMPVDLYIGGKEHATLHLYFARFISHFCADIGLTKHREPFRKLLVQGIIKGKTYKAKKSGKYLSPSEVTETDSGVVERSTGDEVEVSFEKMSKSKLNGVDPQEFVSEWGISLTRLFVLYAAAPYEPILWDTKSDVIPGMMRWQMRLWTNVTMLIAARNNPTEGEVDFESEFALTTQTNKAIEIVTRLYEDTCVLSAAITALMTLSRVTVNAKNEVISNCSEFERSVCVQVIMSAPMMPHFASELWSGLRTMKYKLNQFDWDKDVLEQKWPRVTDVSKPRVLAVWVDKKRCARLLLPNNVEEDSIPNKALKHPKVKKFLKQPILETIVKPDSIKFITANKEIST